MKTPELDELIEKARERLREHQRMWNELPTQIAITTYYELQNELNDLRKKRNATVHQHHAGPKRIYT